MYRMLRDIVAYLEYLNSVCGLSTTVHFSEQKLRWFSDQAFSMLLPYNVHQNLYCTQVKKENWNACTQSQRKVIGKKCENHRFCGTCYAGVCEYICQIIENEAVVGFISVSGYRKPSGKVRSIDVSSWEKNLSEKEIPLALCEAVIPPLCRMFQLLFTYPMEQSANDDYNRILQFIHEQNGQTTLDELCDRFVRSRSYISHLFNEKCGMTLRAYCNDLKLDYAKKLLASTEASITEIALDVGYNDVSYFITLYKKRYGMTPLKFRKQQSMDIY